jgi:hypothetical protein
MKRRTFVWFSALATASLYIPATGCKSGARRLNKSAALPQFLAHICDEKTILEIGNAYKKNWPGESNAAHLTQLILTDSTGSAIAETGDPNNVQALLQQKIAHDFETDETIIIKGWVLSKTEARQCALYTFQA